MLGIQQDEQRKSAGQSLVEFALIIPVLLVIAVAIGDFGRVYVSAVAVESGAREAADYGAFKKDYWCIIDTLTGFCTVPNPNQANVEAEMERRACTAAVNLPRYEEPPGTLKHATCTNPTFSYVLENAPDSGPYSSGCDLSEPGCVKIVHTTMTFDFVLLVPFIPLPGMVDCELITNPEGQKCIRIVRESRFAISELKQPTFGGP